MIKNEMNAYAGGVFKHAVKLAGGTHPWMFLREYVQNGFDAHTKTDSINKQVIVDFDHLYYKENKVFKLCFIDNAIGMEKGECEHALLTMFKNADPKHFGIGAKITGLKRNKTIMVKTKIKKDPHGYMFILNIGDKGSWLETFSDGRRYLEIGLDEFPNQIKEEGTCVTFLGLSDDDNTMAPWETELPHGEWQSALLNDTYFRIPSNINLKCRVNYHKRIDEMVFDETNRIYNFKAKEGGECRLINLKGNQDEYEKYAKASGLLKLSDGTTIHWYVLEDKKNLGFYLRRRKSRIAYVCDNENYETKYGARANFPDWNVHYCSDRIALFIELDSTIYEPDVHRRKINLIGESIHSSGSELPTEKWQAEWKDHFPQQIAKEEELACQNQETPEIDINTLNKLPFIKDDELGKITPEGFDLEEEIEDALTRAIRHANEKKKRTKRKKRGTGFGDLDDFIRRRSEKSSRSKGISVEPNFMPQSLSILDVISEEHDLFGWACRYDGNKDEVIINKKYLGLQKSIETYLPKTTNVHLAKKITDFIINTYIDRIRLAICQAKMIKGKLKIEDFDSMTSKQSLTMVVSPNLREDSFLRKEVAKMRGA
jgi:hypothetical protein